MNTIKTLRNALFATTCSLALWGGANASANDKAIDKGSALEIGTAIRSNNSDAIISALENAEQLVCDSGCITMVMDLLGHEDYSVREVAAWWMGRRSAQTKEATELASSWLVSKDSVKARNGADVLGSLRKAETIPLLSAAAIDMSHDAEARAAAVRALGYIAKKEGNAALKKAMQDKSPLVRMQAVTAWRNVQRQEEATVIVSLVRDSDLTVRREAIATVGKFRTTEARTALESVLQNDSDPAARRNAAWSLGRIGDKASRSVLETATLDPSPLVRMTARAALRKVH